MSCAYASCADSAGASAGAEAEQLYNATRESTSRGKVKWLDSTGAVLCSSELSLSSERNIDTKSCCHQMICLAVQLINNSLDL